MLGQLVSSQEASVDRNGMSTAQYKAICARTMAYLVVVLQKPVLPKPQKYVKQPYVIIAMKAIIFTYFWGPGTIITRKGRVYAIAI